VTSGFFGWTTLSDVEVPNEVTQREGVGDWQTEGSLRGNDHELKAKRDMFKDGCGFGEKKVIDTLLEPKGICRRVYGNGINGKGDGVEKSELAL
jgi:hypothetical protein